MKTILSALAAIVFVLGSQQFASACDNCGVKSCRSVTTCRVVIIIDEDCCEESCDEAFASCVEWIKCPKTCKVIGFYEKCGGCRVAKWSLVEGTVSKTPSLVKGVAWITEDPAYCGKKALKTSSTSCGCGCYTVWVRTCVYKR